MLGGEIVTRTFRDEFVALIQGTLDEYDPVKIEEHYRLCRKEEKEEERIEELRTAAEEYQRLAPRPSPRQIIRRWLSENSCTVAQLAARAEVGDATVYRIMEGKYDYERYSENLKALAAVMDCDWQELSDEERTIIASEVGQYIDDFLRKKVDDLESEDSKDRIGEHVAEYVRDLIQKTIDERLEGA